MKINITKKQYWDLMRGMYMADWMANAICDADMKKDDGIKEARNYIFSFAKEFGYEDYAEYDDELGNYYATFDMDDEPVTQALIERYDECVSWDEIGEWLGERDFYRKYTREEIEAMSGEDYFMKFMECQIVWEEEFEKHGIERLKIDEAEERKS